jgi:5-methylcytosine-specific restriction endonuclease McrA
MVIKNCETCGKGFTVKPYRAATARFCSFTCGGSWHAKTRLALVRKPFALGNQLRKGLRPAHTFTSEEVSGSKNIKWQEGVVLTCHQCAKVFRRKPWLIRQNNKNSKVFFCSRACFTKSEIWKGEKSPCWVGGPKTYRGRGWKQARLKAVERDDGTCQGCGKRIGPSIPVHHRTPYREFATPEEANRLENLVCLCQSCHMRQEPRLSACSQS